MGEKDDISLLGYIKPVMLVSGSLPLELVETNKGLYRFYQFVTRINVSLFLISLYVEVPRLQGAIGIIFQRIITLFLSSIMYIKGHVCRSKNIRNLIVNMVRNESEIKASDSKDVLDIYRSITTRSKFVQIFYIILSVLAFITFVFPSYKYLGVSSAQKKNSSNIDDYLPYQMYMPFDQNEYYFTALFIQSYCAWLVSNYYCFSQCILIILPLHTTLRLKLLANNLKKIGAIGKYNIDRKEYLDNVRKMFTSCIKEHVDIIETTSVLNESLKYLMLLEFLLSSAQISLVLMEITSTEDSGLLQFSITYLLQLLAQLLILYGHAEEIRQQSVGISDVLYEMPWYEYNKSITANIQIMMVRSQKPLPLSVGPFGEMSLAMAVKIIRAGYTYMTFMQQTYSDQNKHSLDSKADY